APQALFLLNSDWVIGLCDRLAGALLREADGDDAGRVRRLYLKAYGREATGGEVAKALALIHDVERALRKREADAERRSRGQTSEVCGDFGSLGGSRQDAGPRILSRRRLLAWSSLCQVVVSANEFIYVR